MIIKEDEYLPAQIDMMSLPLYKLPVLSIPHLFTYWSYKRLLKNNMQNYLSRSEKTTRNSNMTGRINSYTYICVCAW